MALTEPHRQLLVRCLREEAGAWQDFVDQFIGLFAHVIHHTALTRSVQLRAEDVDDLCSEIFLALVAKNYEVLRRFKGKSSLVTYLVVISRRIVVREIGKRRLMESSNGLDTVEAGISTTTDAIERIDDRDLLARMLTGLPPADAEVVRQYHFHGRSYREISAELGIPVNSIGPTLSRARDLLRQQLPPMDAATR